MKISPTTPTPTTAPPFASTQVSNSMSATSHQAENTVGRGSKVFTMKLQDVTNVTTLKKYLAERGSPWMSTPTTTFFQSVIPSRYFRWVGDGVVFISSEQYPHCDRHYAVRKLMELPDGWPVVAHVSGNYPNLKMATYYAHKVVAEYRAREKK